MDIIKRVINEWDPIGLMSHCPSDEYQTEIEAIKKILIENNNASQIADEIFDVFIDSFGQDIFTAGKGECFFIAKKILAEKNRNET